MTASYPQVLLRNRHADRIATLDEYRAGGGYGDLHEILNQWGPTRIRGILKEAALLGRGGAAFPMGTKLGTIPEDAPFPRYIICNADEMEPGTFKDRVLIHADPHQLIEGMILAGFAAGAEEGFIFIRPEYENAARILTREIEIARAAGFLGRHIGDSPYSFELTVHRSAGRYICGEVTAQINALMGKRPNPTQPPPYPTARGLWGQPTLTQNVETLAYVPHIVRHGAQWFKALALTDAGAGTKLYGVSGRVNRPGCYELPLGIPLNEIIEAHAGGMPEGAEFKACLPGGASTGFLPREHYGISMDFEALKKAGNRLGTAAIMVFDQHDCLVAATLNLIEFFTRESCGWCTPCREGLPYIRDLLWRIEHGQGEPGYIEIMERMAAHLWHSYCAFAPGAAAPVQSLLEHYRDEIRDHITARRCPFGRAGG
jgi:NADH-quinone oxidoreductase subunit F